MYKGKLWDEDKWNIHSEGYHSSGGSAGNNEPKYHEQKYGSAEKDASSDYIKKQDSADKDEKKKEELSDFEEELKTKNESNKEEDIAFKAAKQVFAENRLDTKKQERKKDLNSIEDAIKKAIEDEKKVIVMD